MVLIPTFTEKLNHGVAHAREDQEARYARRGNEVIASRDYTANLKLIATRSASVIEIWCDQQWRVVGDEKDTWVAIAPQVDIACIHGGEGLPLSAE